MAEFQEDMLFKNVADEDASILLEFIGKKSKRTKVWTNVTAKLRSKEIPDSKEIILLSSVPLSKKCKKYC